MSDISDEIPDPEHRPNVAADLSRGAGPHVHEPEALERLLEAEESPGQ